MFPFGAPSGVPTRTPNRRSTAPSMRRHKRSTVCKNGSDAPANTLQHHGIGRAYHPATGPWVSPSSAEGAAKRCAAGRGSHKRRRTTRKYRTACAYLTPRRPVCLAGSHQYRICETADALRTRLFRHRLRHWRRHLLFRQCPVRDSEQSFTSQSGCAKNHQPDHGVVGPELHSNAVRAQRTDVLRPALHARRF